MKTKKKRKQTLVPTITELVRIFIINFEKNRAARAALRFAQKADFPHEHVVKLEETIRESAKLQKDTETKLEEYFSQMETQKDEGHKKIQHFNRKILPMPFMVGHGKLRPGMMDNNQ